MIGRRSAVGLAVLCALMISAIAASGASAVNNTAYTCVKGQAPVEFFGAHCLKEGTGTKEYGHLEITPKTKTKIVGTNANTASETKAAAVATLAGSISGVATELSCTGLSGEGEMENNEEAGEMFAAGSTTGATGLNYTGCTVVKPSGKGCLVTGGKVSTNPLSARSDPKLTGALIFKPTSGETFAEISIEKCSVEALNKVFPVTGEITAKTNGATTITTEAEVTEQGLLKFGGNKAGLGGALTISMKEGNPIVLT